MNILFTGFKISYYEIDSNKPKLQSHSLWIAATFLELHTHSLLRYDKHTHVYFPI